MIRPAASQHSAPLEGVMAALSRILPPAEIQKATKLRRRTVAGRLRVKIRLPVVVRAYGVVKAGLALIGLAAVCAGALVAWRYDFDVPSFRQAAGEVFFPPAVE